MNCTEFTPNVFLGMSVHLPLPLGEARYSPRSLKAGRKEFMVKINNFHPEGNKSKKDNRHSFECPQSVKVYFANETIQLPKIGNVNFVCSRTFEGTIGRYQPESVAAYDHEKRVYHQLPAYGTEEHIY